MIAMKPETERSQTTNRQSSITLNLFHKSAVLKRLMPEAQILFRYVVNAKFWFGPDCAHRFSHLIKDIRVDRTRLQQAIQSLKHAGLVVVTPAEDGRMRFTLTPLALQQIPIVKPTTKAAKVSKAE